MIESFKALIDYLKPALTIVKRFLMVFTVFSAAIILFLYFWRSNTPKVTRQDVTLQHRAELYKIINDKELNKTNQGKAYISTVRTMTCMTLGEGCTANPADGDKNVRNSLTGSISNLVTFPIAAPPASGVETALDTLQHAGFIPQANAAMGVGYAAISPYKSIWTIFRNLVFLLIVIFVIAIGFLIMFRRKINAQTVVSIENSLPKIALTMIFITFSFAIAGFMIDLMYISMFFLAGIFVTPGVSSSNELSSVSHIMSQALWGKNGGAFGFLFDWESVRLVATGFYQFIPGAARAILDQVVGAYGYKVIMWLVALIPGAKSTNLVANNANMVEVLKSVFQFLPFVDKTTTTGTPIGSFVTGILSLTAQQIITTVLAPVVVTFFITLVLMVSLFIVFFRVLIMLLKAYIQIIIQIMFAPVFILFEIVPGQSGFTNWLKSLFINLITFPLLLMLLLVSKVIINTDVTPNNPELINVGAQTYNSTFWQPPFIWGFDSEAFKYIIGGALLFMTPELVSMFKEMTGVKAQDMKLNPLAFFGGAMVLGKAAFGAPGRFASVRHLAESIGSEDGREQRKKFFDALPPVARNLFYGVERHQEGGGHAGG